jgi:hypothetical protein
MSKRALSLFVLGACFAIAVAPILQMVLPIVREPPLAGVLTEAVRPAIGLGAIGNEKFQKDFVKWFDQHYGFRPTATRVDNSINFHVFQETRPEQAVKVGREGALFLNEQIWFHNRTDDPSVGIEKFSRNLKAVQELLAARGKYLVVMILPSKSSVYPERVPRGWSLPLPAPRPADERVYRAFVRSLDRAGATYIDGRALAEQEFPGPLRDRVYSATGRHLNAPASCRILDEAIKLARPHLPDVTIPPLDCTSWMAPADSVEGEEFDLFRLANVWASPPTMDVPRMKLVDEIAPFDRRPGLMVVGSSFAWRPVFEAERTKTFGRIHLFYYNKTVVDRDGRPFYPVPPPHSEAWRALVDPKILYLLPCPEEFLPDHNGDFLAELLEELTDKRE